MAILEPSYDTVTTEIVRLLNLVSGIGKTFNYKPFTLFHGDRSDLVVSNAMHFWYTWRDNAPAVLLAQQGQEIRERYVIEGWHSLDEHTNGLQGNQSEILFNRVIDGIRGEFTGIVDLVAGATISQPLQIEQFINDDDIAGVTSHHVIMSMILTITQSSNC